MLKQIGGLDTVSAAELGLLLPAHPLLGLRRFPLQPVEGILQDLFTGEASILLLDLRQIYKFGLGDCHFGLVQFVLQQVLFEFLQGLGILLVGQHLELAAAGDALSLILGFEVEPEGQKLVLGNEVDYFLLLEILVEEEDVFILLALVVGKVLLL